MGLMQPVAIGGVTVQPGDFVFGDDDGVVVVPPEKAPAVLAEARAIAHREARAAVQLAQGISFAEVMARRAAEEGDARGEAGS